MNVRAHDLLAAEPRFRILRFPLVRIPVCVLFLLLYLLPHNTLIGDLIAPLTGTTRTVVTVIDAGVSTIALLLLYGLYTRWVEGRQALELGRDGAFQEFASGFLISTGIVVLMVITMGAAGFYRSGGVGSIGILVDAFVYFGIGALVQVLIFRLVLFRLSEEVFGTWAALAGVAAIFGLAHLGNDNATVWTTLAFLPGDLILAAAFIYTRRLWMVWGIHAGWNFMQDGVFGLPNSGLTDLPSWITPVVDGPTWLTGGTFGIEASPVQLMLSVGIALVILRRAWTGNQMVAAAWRRS